MKIGILGAGGFAREVFCWATQAGYTVVHFYDGTKESSSLTIGGETIPVSNKLLDNLNYVIGVGDPTVKEKILSAVGTKQLADPIVHPTAILGFDIEIGSGSIVAPNVIITTNVVIGPCASLNLGTTIGHDCRIGRLFNAAPSANISGNVTIGDMVTIGTNAAIREKIKIAENIVIGMGTIVTKDLLTAGTYIGSPARKLTRD